MSNKITAQSVTPNRVLEILFAEAMQPGDLDILVKATRARPGSTERGPAGRAGAGSAQQPAVYSGSGAKIGFVAPSREAEPPYQHTYLLQQEAERYPRGTPCPTSPPCPKAPWTGCSST